jgi:hypothetical protein
MTLNLLREDHPDHAARLDEIAPLLVDLSKRPIQSVTPDQVTAGE